MSASVTTTTPSTDPESSWPRETSERCDFYHRPRAFPESIAKWRRGMLARLSVICPEKAEQARAAFDAAISLLREVARFAEILYPEARQVLKLSSSRDAIRVLERLDPLRELARVVGNAQHKPRALELVPPNLDRSLASRLADHGKRVCHEAVPECGSCEFRAFCGYWRSQQCAEAERSTSPTVIDLFCGAGGLSEGFSRAGFHSLGALDADPVALRTYSLNHPAVPEANIACADIRELAQGFWRKLTRGKRLDVLAAAPPCQGFSHAGFRSKSSRTGYTVASDERNFLFEPALEIALALKPRFVVLENVPGMQSAKRENLSFLEQAAGLLEDRGGYSTATWRVNAAAFGVPQDRERYFLVASARGEQLPFRPSEEYQDARGRSFDLDALPSVTLDEAIFDLPAISAGTGEALALWTRTPEDLRSRRYLKKFGLLRDSVLLFNHAARFQNARDLELYALLRPGEDSVHAIERYKRSDLMRYRTDVFDDKYHRLRPDRPSKTMVSHLAKDGNGFIHPSQVRGITPREAARLQSFHDGYAFCGSVSDQWVQIGNAVPPVMGEMIARSIGGSLKLGR